MKEEEGLYLEEECGGGCSSISPVYQKIRDDFQNFRKTVLGEENIEKGVFSYDRDDTRFDSRSPEPFEEEDMIYYNFMKSRTWSEYENMEILKEYGVGRFLRKIKHITKETYYLDMLQFIKTNKRKKAKEIPPVILEAIVTYIIETDILKI
jgi:hypothetical protein